MKKIAIGSDHGGFELKEEIKNFLLKEGYEVKDFGTNSNSSCDYPDYAIPVAEAVVAKEFEFGILICGTGIGMSIAANKVKGVRCAHVSNINEAELAKLHNNANIIAMSYKKDINIILDCINKFIETKFSNEERHIRRINEIINYEKEN